MSSAWPVSSRVGDQAADDVVELDDRVLVGVLRRRRPRGTGRGGSCRSGRPGCRGSRTRVASPSAIRAHEVLGVGAPLVVEQGQDGDGHLLDRLGLPAPLGVDEAPVERQVLDPGRAGLGVDDLREEVGVAPLAVHVRDRQEAVEVVEADVLGLGLDVLAQVPLADGLGDVAGIGQQLGQGDLAMEAARLAVHRRALQPVAHRQAAREQRRPAGGARRLRVARGHQQAPAGQAVDVGRRGPDGHAAAVAAEVPPAHVVHEDDQQVRAAPVGAVGVQGGSSPLLLAGQDEVRFQAPTVLDRLRHHWIVCHDRTPLRGDVGRRNRWRRPVPGTPHRTLGPPPGQSMVTSPGSSRAARPRNRLATWSS